VAEQRSSRSRFVVKGARDQAGVEPLGGDRGVVTTSADADPKVSWRRLVTGSGRPEWAAPVIEDEAGNESYPTGEVTVRFVTPPTDEQLEQLASEHGLRPARRNRYVPAQVAFAPAQPREVYLPELCEQLATTDGVASAWVNTTSAYRRTDSWS
jgi:hypothetical protein